MKPKTKKRLIIALISISLLIVVLAKKFPLAFEYVGLISLVTLVNLFTWNHTDTIRKVNEPAQKELGVFYQKHKRHPNTKERNAILEHSGCKIVNENVCEYGGISIGISSYSDMNRIFAYKVKLTKGYSECWFGLYREGDQSGAYCDQNSPIIIKQ